MAVLPNPFFDSPLEPAMAGDTAAGLVLTVSPDPAAVQFRSSMAMEVTEEAPVAAEPSAAGATDHIHEIFHYARKLLARDRRFVLNEAAFMEAIEPPPLFLQRM